MDEGNFGGKPIKPLPQPETIKEYEKRANPELRPHDRKVVRKSFYDLTKWGLWILFALVLVLGYAVLNDSFKSDINIPKCPEPATIPACPECPECPIIPECPSNNLTCGNLNCGDVVVPSNSS